MQEKERIAHIISELEKLYPQDLCSLQYRIPHELLIAVRLSAQCTDARVNQVVPALFAKYPSIEAFAEADVADVEEMVRSCGFYHTKARDIVEMCKMLREEYGGVVPDSIEELTRLPGVGRKTANLICGDIFLCLRYPLYPYHQSVGSYYFQRPLQGRNAAAGKNPPGKIH